MKCPNGFVECLGKWLRGHQPAIEFVKNLFAIVEVWDDLHDGDREVSKAGINRAFHTALVALPRNCFYRDHFLELNPIIEMAILDWYAANEMEATKDIENMRMSFVLRSSGFGVIILCAKIIGGIEWAREVQSEIRLNPVTTDGDKWGDYIAKYKVQ